MSRQIVKDLPELVQAGIITAETSENIRAYYLQRSLQAPNRQILVFSILGAVLVGLGIVLIIAHNWDEFPRPAKIVFALLPLLSGQLLCAYALLKRPTNRSWREGGAVFLFFAVAAAIAIVSQVYNIPGDLSAFIFIWMMLTIPLIYAMQSGMTSLLVIIGITTYACNVSYFNYPTEIAWYYWAMLAAIVPFFLDLVRKRSANFVTFHQWFLALSVIISLNMFSQSDSFYMFVAYMSLFSIYILLGDAKRMSGSNMINNAFLVTGSLGSVILLLMFSFGFLWTEIAREATLIDEGFVVSVIVTLIAVALLAYEISKRGASGVHPLAYLFIIFVVLFELGKVQPGLSKWLVNVLVLGVGVLTTWRGAEKDNILILNYGLMIMATLILCRFFDTDMSFVVRGVLFVLVGVSFFATNYWVLRRRKLQNL